VAALENNEYLYENMVENEDSHYECISQVKNFIEDYTQTFLINSKLGQQSRSTSNQ
jgi:hypothetical protein